jgi:hypothetical protein
MDPVLSTKIELSVGSIVKTIGKASYDDIIPIGTTGTITKIRHRYIDTPNEYKQFKVIFLGYLVGDDLTNLYEDYNLSIIL